jgi:hypothetical protein
MTRCDHERARCGEAYAAAVAARREVTALVAAALEHGRELGLDGQELAWVLDDARAGVIR